MPLSNFSLVLIVSAVNKFNNAVNKHHHGDNKHKTDYRIYDESLDIVYEFYRFLAHFLKTKLEIGQDFHIRYVVVQIECSGKN